VEPALDLVVRAELPGLDDGVGHCQRVAQTLRLAEEPGQGRQIPPGRREEPPVAAAGTAADDVLLQQGDPKTGVTLPQANRGPQPGEPAPDDAHVGDDVRLERRTRLP